MGSENNKSSDLSDLIEMLSKYRKRLVRYNTYFIEVDCKVEAVKNAIKDDIRVIDDIVKVLSGESSK